MTRWVKGLSRIDANSLLYSGLLAFLLACYVVLVYILVTATVVTPYYDLRNPAFSPPVWANALAFAVIAGTFMPVARLLSRRIDDLVYAEHDDPYALVSRITRQLQIVSDPRRGLPILAESVAGELRLPYVAIEVTAVDPPLNASYGAPPANAGLFRLPITHLEMPLGVLRVSARGELQRLTTSDMNVLADIARQLGIVFYSFHLSASLQSTRERLVAAREEERRRIRNDLHDGLAPTLASLQLQLGAVRGLIHQDPAQAEAAVNEMRDDLRTATASIRQLVYDLRPPLLDELGLVAAIRNIRLGSESLRLDVTAPDAMPKLPAAVEVAVYRIASEAVHNVLRHAQATACHVTIKLDAQRLTLSVCDNGRGLPDAPLPGVGLSSMRERATELGGELTMQQDAEGGTRLTAKLPVEVEP